VTAYFAELQARLAGQPTAAISSSGRSFPLGAAVLSNGINFSVFSRHASRVELLLFDDAKEPRRPIRAIDLEARKHRTYHYWHVFVPGIRAGQLYGYRVTGTFAPEHGLRFDPSKVLLDPYGRAVAVPDGYSRQMASLLADSRWASWRCLACLPSPG
jgi:isoamylase